MIYQPVNDLITFVNILPHYVTIAVQAFYLYVFLLVHPGEKPQFNEGDKYTIQTVILKWVLSFNWPVVKSVVTNAQCYPRSL